MNNLVAAWHQPAEVDLTGQQFDVVELLSRAHDLLVDVPELKTALRLVHVALDEVSAWFDGASSTHLVSSP
jgi:hypothetical protein